MSQFHNIIVSDFLISTPVARNISTLRCHVKLTYNFIIKLSTIDNFHYRKYFTKYSQSIHISKLKGARYSGECNLVKVNHL